jgi:Domain of unknown function (DUF4279)
MSKPAEQYAYFSVTGGFDPDDITRRVGVPPTEAWRKGDLHPRTRLERKFSRWSVRSRLALDRSLEDHIGDVLSQLDERRADFQAVAAECGGCMQLVGYFHEGYPGLHFDAGLVEQLSQYRLSVDFDLYDLWSDQREDTGP